MKSEGAEVLGEKKWKSCPHCNGRYGQAFEDKVSGGHYWMMACRCGHLTKLFSSRDDLYLFWNMRAGKKPHMPKVEIKRAKRNISGDEF